MKIFLSLILIALASFSYIAAPVTDDNEKVMQGTWRLTGSNGKHAWFLEWTFAEGKFELKGYPPLHQQGKYRIVKTEDNKLTLELYEQSGNFGTENKQMQIIVNKEKDTLMIDDKGPFNRIKDKS